MHKSDTKWTGYVRCTRIVCLYLLINVIMVIEDEIRNLRGRGNMRGIGGGEGSGRNRDAIFIYEFLKK